MCIRDRFTTRKVRVTTNLWFHLYFLAITFRNFCVDDVDLTVFLYGRVWIGQFCPYIMINGLYEATGKRLPAIARRFKPQVGLIKERKLLRPL